MVAPGQRTTLPGYVRLGVNTDGQGRLALPELPDLSLPIKVLGQPFRRGIYRGKSRGPKA